MDLRQLKAYLIEHKQATLTDLAHHFRTEPPLVQTLLEHWIRKGKVQHTHIDECAKGCCRGGSDLEVYRWIDGKPLISNISIPVVQQN
ncbi:FeoC-like transcriptional regulator [Candidatus Albibeggiatoa sp. nov. BB20]|uniref:FeoC-like transcriptional regulator n=1 Tax=Candidatus Albibeggiatoa sp. nov. BB20 TaxID=3162723 RepID=UPI0033654F03